MASAKAEKKTVDKHAKECSLKPLLTFREGFDIKIKQQEFEVICLIEGCDHSWTKKKAGLTTLKKDLVEDMVLHIFGESHLNLIADISEKSPPFRKLFQSMKDEKETFLVEKNYEDLEKHLKALLSTRECAKLKLESNIIRGRIFLQEYSKAMKAPESEKVTELVKLNVEHSMYKQVTSQMENVFVGNGSRDRYTGWSKDDYDKYDVLDIGHNHPAMIIIGGKKGGKKHIYEVDHVWELQIMVHAVFEVSRICSFNFCDVKDIIRDALNSVENLNCTSWTVNIGKKSIMDAFKKKHSVSTNNSMEISAIIIDMKNPMMKIFNSNVPDFESVKDFRPTIFTTIRDKMKEILETHFFKKFLEPEKDPGTDGKLFLKLLYGVLCDMYIKMYGEDEVDKVSKPRLRKKVA